MGGRLRHFLPKWEQITRDQWVLNIIKEGYKLEFIQKPPFSGIKETKVRKKDQALIDSEIQELLNKNALEIVRNHQTQTGFYSTLFLVPKKNGEMRPVGIILLFMELLRDSVNSNTMYICGHLGNENLVVVYR